MFKKIIISAAILALTGCSSVRTQETNVSKPSSDFVVINDNLDYHYLVHEPTGVVYLEYRSGYKQAITVMLNPDGTPITADQLGIDIEK